MAASSLLLNPDAHFGENVSLMAAVETVLSKTAFTVDQDKAKTTGKEVLIIAPTLTGVVQPNTYVTVTGEVVKFDPAEVARKLKGYTLDIAPDVVAKFQGQPAVFATAVITPGLLDIAKRVAPPMTPAEQAYSKIMKGVGSAFPALRTGLDGSNAAAAKENVAILKKSFADVQAFWKERNTADAGGWAQEASKHTEPSKPPSMRASGTMRRLPRERCSNSARPATPRIASGRTTERSESRAAGSAR